MMQFFLKIIKFFWFILSILILLITVYHKGKGDIHIFYIYSMLFLTFPSGLIPYFIFILMLILKENISKYFYVYFYENIFPDWVPLFLLWLIVTVFGYFQWFILIPKIWEKFKNIYYQRKIKRDN